MQKDSQTTPETVDWSKVRQGINDDSAMEISRESDLSLDMLFSDTTAMTSGDRGTPHDEKGKAQAILDKRARALAKTTEEETGDSMQLVVFSLANETYGIPTEYVKEVQPLRSASPVPCTPGFVVGVVNIRGSIYSVVDIRDFFGVPKREITDLTKVILVNAAGLEVGILADDISEAMNVPLAEIKPPLSAGQGQIKEEYIQGVTKDTLIILNLEAVLRDERVVVHEQVA